MTMNSCAVTLLIVIGAQRGPAQSTWTIDRAPIFNVGAESDDTLMTFGQIRGVARLANGDVVIADQKNYALRYFTAAGRFRRAVGRRGDGPGEFQAILRMLHCGDSLFVTDFGTPRWSVFSAERGFSRTFLLKSPQKDPRMVGAAVPYALACNADGVFIGYGWPTSSDRTLGASRSDAPFWLSRPDGNVAQLLGTHPGSERWNTERGSGPRPLGRETAIAIGRKRVYIGTADSFAIMVFDLAGKQIGTIRKLNSEVRTAPADIQRSIVLDTAGKDRRLITTYLRIHSGMKYPATLPAYSALVVDSDDNLWVQRYPRAADHASRWIVFSATGAELAQIDLPLDLTVHEIGRDYVMGVVPEPPDGVQHVEMFRLHR